MTEKQLNPRCMLPVSENAANHEKPRIAYETDLGTFVLGQVERVLVTPIGEGLSKKVDLIFTSPPFPLNTKKRYGNLKGQEYVDWLAGMAKPLRALLKPRGSIVIELGNAWEQGKPIMSTLALRALLAFLEAGKFTLCQQFVWNNPAKLPTPAQWVNIERIRLKDAYTHLWWMSTSDRPYADNRQVLSEYSQSMKDLLARQSYNTGRRPSEHHIGKKSFLTNNSGAIPSNVITVSNTHSNTAYLRFCREHHIQP
ncbi:MAG: DNA methyltransferase, partial [Bryobacteraceae bacterium]